MVAEGLGNKVGGAFRASVSSAVKYGLVDTGKGRIKTKPLFQDYRLAYSEAQKNEALRKAFLSVPLFTDVGNRLQGQAVPGHLEKLLIREYDVPEEIASRVSEYFVEGAKETGILASNGLIIVSPPTDTRITPGTGDATLSPEDIRAEVDNLDEVPGTNTSSPQFMRYNVRIYGPGIDTRIAIKDLEDLEIVEVTLKKVRKLLKAEQEKQQSTS